MTEPNQNSTSVAGTWREIPHLPTTGRDSKAFTLRQMLLVVLALNIVLMAATLSENSIQSDRGLYIAVWLGMMVMLMADLVALYWVGLWQGIAARNLARVSTSSVVPVLVVP